MSDEDFRRDAVALSQIASKMPTPPFRPPSIASSTRSSSKRSSAASTSYRQSRHASFGFDLETSEAPPTPSISSRYASATLADELSQSMDIASGSNTGLVDKSSSVNSSPRLARNRSTSSFTGHAVKRRSSRALKEKEQDSLNVATVAKAATPTPHTPRWGSKVTSSKAQSIDQRNSIVGDLSASHSNADGVSHSQRRLEAILSFSLDFIVASSMLWSIVVWPMAWAMVDSITYLFSSPATEKEITPQTKIINPPTPSKEVETSFAERFKFIICTSRLLTSTLSISGYDQGVVQPSSAPATEADSAGPSSTIDPHPVKAVSSDPRGTRSNLHLTKAGRLLFDATCVAMVFLIPLTRNQQVWAKSTVFLVSLVWSVVASIGIDGSCELSFELSHRPVGSYSLLAHDSELQAEASSNHLSISKAGNIKDNMCEQVTSLMEACKEFDIECNKVIAFVQEAELVSRGFKLTHPLPPISRIEANSRPTSPPRTRNGSWQTPASSLNATRLSRSSSSGASTASGWKHHGSRPQSILFSSESTTQNGRHSPQEVELESVRSPGLRKGLFVRFEEAQKALSLAIKELSPLVDNAELELLREMYELDQSQSAQSAVMETRPSAGIRSISEKRSSWAPYARLRMEDEPASPVGNDDGDRPTTPQRFLLLSENGTSLSGSARKRDSGMSETWSVSSPTREASSLRTGSRLGYVSDKTSTSITPNQTAESKRLSYMSSLSSFTSPLTTKSLLQQPTSPPSGFLQLNRKRASLLNSGLLDDQKPGSVILNSNATSKTDVYLIASLKSLFEQVHSLRRRVLCHLLALDFDLSKSISKAAGGSTSTVLYWAAISRVMKQLTSTLSRLATECTQELQKEVNIGQEEKMSAKQSSADAAAASATANESNRDFTGMEDRLTAMGYSLRSIQMKMIVCAENLAVKSPPTLHGTSTAKSSGLTKEVSASVTTKNEKSEKVLESIREDLLTLSAEWENALKILRSQSSSTLTSAVGDTTASTLNSSRLDSPQEAEEDALRQWVQARRGADESSDSEDERMASQIIESGLLQWSGRNGDGDKWQEQGDLSDLLVKTASPDHLPPPGLEKVYESMGGILEARKQRSGLSREQRIQLAKEERAAAAKNSTGKTNTTGLEASSGMIQELQAVMKNRKPINVNEDDRTASKRLLGLESSFDLGQSTTTPLSDSNKQNSPAF